MTKAIPISKYNIPIGLFLFTFVLLLWTQSDYGLAWDEPYNFNPALSVWDWSKLLVSDSMHAFSDRGITKYWEPIHEHPSFSKLLAAFSYGIFHSWVRDLVSLRLGEILFFSLFISLFYMFLTNVFSKTIGLFSSLILLFMPRIFAQSHFATTDIPMMIMAFYTMICFYKGLDSWKWSLILGIVWGLALATKINALFLPIPLLLWGHVFHREKWARNFFCMFFISPIIFVLFWPWLWHHSLDRIFEYLHFYTGHKFTTVFYFGKMYTLVPAPWHYPLVYTLTTIPIVTIILILLGIFQILRKSGISAFTKPKDSPIKENLRPIGFLFIFMSLFPILFQSLPNTPRYDGIRLFLSAFPFLAGLAGLGFVAFLRMFANQGIFLQKSYLHHLLMFLFLLPSLFHTFNTHPHQLSYYNYFVGGISGAHKLGMESTYWCESVNKDVLQYLNQNLSPNSKIRFLSFSDEVLQWYKEHGYLRSDIDCFPKEKPDYFLLQCRQGFFGREEWFLYRNVKPVKSFQLSGVSLIDFYLASGDIP